MPEQPIPKGSLGGSCNRRACNNDGAFFFNIGTEKYYCIKCGKEIRSCNPEMDLYPNWEKDFKAWLEWAETQ